MMRATSMTMLTAVLLLAYTPAGADVTVFQQGISPQGYEGCTDTMLSGYYDNNRSHQDDSTIYTPGKRRGLIHYDLSALPEGQTIHKALLRLYLVDVPTTPQTVRLFAVGKSWEPTATWLETRKHDDEKSPEANWDKPGGDIDEQADFGHDTAGLVAEAETRSGPQGHFVELDITPIVRQWVTGERDNHGLMIEKGMYGGIRMATSEWPIKAFRPELVIAHSAPDETPADHPQLSLAEPPGAEATLSPLAKTGSHGHASGETKTVRFGRNANCQYVSGHAAVYTKTDPRYPGNWGWTPRMRIGGTAGDFNRGLLYFDLSSIPEGAVIKSASLKVFAECGNQRPPSQEMAMNQVPEETEKEAARRIRSSMALAKGLSKYSFGVWAVQIPGVNASPGWVANECTDTRRAAGTPWSSDGATLEDVCGQKPVAVTNLAEQWKDALAVQDSMPETWISWDVTGVVRAWTAGTLPNQGLMIDHRISGGHMVVYSDEYYRADRRPYLEIELVGDLQAKPDGPPEKEPLVPQGEYWIEPMRTVHARWEGTEGTFSQYGDSITVTMAFWLPIRHTTFRNVPNYMVDALKTVRAYLHEPSWQQWKGGKWGCTGSTRIPWAFENIDEWQKRMNAESAVILWGTNDAAGGPPVPEYTEMYGVVVNRGLQDGTVPILTTLPPFSRQRSSMQMFLTVWNLRLAVLACAKANQTPVIDLWGEMIRRRPDDWDGRLEKFRDDIAKEKGGVYNAPTMIAGDGIHPSFPAAYRDDWSEEALRHCGLGLRNYLTLKTWYKVYQNVLRDNREETGHE